MFSLLRSLGLGGFLSSTTHTAHILRFNIIKWIRFVFTYYIELSKLYGCVAWLAFANLSNASVRNVAQICELIIAEASMSSSWPHNDKLFTMQYCLRNIKWGCGVECVEHHPHHPLVQRICINGCDWIMCLQKYRRRL